MTTIRKARSDGPSNPSPFAATYPTTPMAAMISTANNIRRPTFGPDALEVTSIRKARHGKSA